MTLALLYSDVPVDLKFNLNAFQKAKNHSEIFKNLCGKNPVSYLVYFKSAKISDIELNLFKQLKIQFPFLELIVAVNTNFNKVDTQFYYKNGVDYPVFYNQKIDTIQSRIEKYFKLVKNTSAKTDSFLLSRNRSSFSLKGKTVNLSKTEYNLMDFLLQNQGAIISKEVLLEAVWGYKDTVFTKTLEVNLGKLRAKLKKVENHKFIKTVYGQGYILDLP
jgi:DNA-binding winged helix-turn-helix (wHTH) protein